MLLATTLPVVAIYRVRSSWLGSIVIANGLAGGGIGTFESVFLSMVAPLGPVVASTIMLGLPGAFGLINVLGLLLTSGGVPPEVIYWSVIFSIVIAWVLLRSCFPEGSHFRRTRRS